jgi:streptomycin 6-kinase
MIVVPQELRRLVASWFGERGEQWLAALPETVSMLAARWDLRVPPGDSFPGGTHALVLPVFRADGQPAALKVPVVDEENYGEPLALRAYDGDGAVQLYEHDAETGGMLMELARPGTFLSRYPDRVTAARVLSGLLCRLRRPVPEALAGLPDARDIAANWAARFPAAQQELRLPEMDEVVAGAAALAARYADAPEGPELLINRDAHLENVLAAEREPWLLIDPKPLRGEPAFEGGHPVLTLLPGAQFTSPAGSPAGSFSPGFSSSLGFSSSSGFSSSAAVVPSVADAARVVALVADGLGVSRERIRGWALLRAVENALWAARLGHDPAPDIAQAKALFAAPAAG